MNPSFRERVASILFDTEGKYLSSETKTNSEIRAEALAEILSLVNGNREPLIDAALAYHHAKDREESKRLKLKFIEACANYEHSLNEIGDGDE